MRNKFQRTSESNDCEMQNAAAKNVAEGAQQDVVAKPRQKLPTWKRILLVATYTLLVCAVACGCTLGVQQAYAESSQSTFIYMRDPRKNTLLISEYFDDFVAFGGGDPYCVSSEEILGCKFISESDKIVFEEYCTKSATNKFNIYLGQKNGKDTVLIYAVGGYSSAKVLNGEDIGVLMFDSNLEYSFASIVKAFEELSGTTLTQEFLRNRFSEDDRKYPEVEYWVEQCPIPTFYDHTYLDGVGGITIRFRALQSYTDYVIDEGFFSDPSLKREFGEIYFAKINGQIYGVTREMLMFDYKE